MCLDVSVEIGGARVPFRAHVTAEGLVSDVLQHVLLEVGVRDKLLVAVLALEVLLSVVPLHVHRQAAGLREALGADRADVRPLARVGPPVHYQCA